MGARKIVERVVVDGITGEVLDSQISFVKWQSERFLMMRNSVVRGVQYWLPADIYCGLFVVSEHSGIYGIKGGIKWYYFNG